MKGNWDFISFWKVINGYVSLLTALNVEILKVSSHNIWYGPCIMEKPLDRKDMYWHSTCL